MGSSDSKKIIREFIEKNYLPSEDQTIIIKEVWDGRYRVNIVNKDSFKIQGSYFIRTQDEKIVYCNPKLSA